MSDEQIVESVIQRPDKGPQETELGDRASSKRTSDDTESARKRLRSEVGHEELKRGKRLFGNLLGTLGGIKREASSVKSKERASKQAELEQRQKERLQKAADDLALKQAEAKVEEERDLYEQEKLLQHRLVEAKHDQILLLANQLVTKTDLPLCYLPWKLTREQEDRIDEQVRIAKQEQAEALKLFSNGSHVERDVVATSDNSGDSHISTSTVPPTIHEDRSMADKEDAIGATHAAVSTGHTDDLDRPKILEGPSHYTTDLGVEQSIDDAASYKEPVEHTVTDQDYGSNNAPETVINDVDERPADAPAAPTSGESANDILEAVPVADTKDNSAEDITETAIVDVPPSASVELAGEGEKVSDITTVIVSDPESLLNEPAPLESEFEDALNDTFQS